jgi:hypothetical protein
VIRSTIAITLLALLVGGCATSVNGPTQRIHIDSLPTGASLTILQTGQQLTAPVEVELRRDAVYTIQATLEGYEPAMGYLDRVTSDAVLGNILLGGSIGASVDADSGAGYALTPNPLVVPLRPMKARSDVMPAPAPVASP